MRLFQVVLSLCIGLGGAFSHAGTANHNEGATIFSERCVLCHGSQGMGEGALAMSLKDYPSTNLLHNIKSQTKEDVVDVVANGSGIESFMPPWKDELSKEQIASVSEFIMFMREDSKQALEVISSLENKKQKSISDGKRVYDTRCVLCHGATGLGDGRMRRVIKSPPPFNLTLSRMPESYLKLIVSEGGGALNRSPQMPPWKDQLTAKEIEAVAAYIVTLRK
jgi:cytochrome c oxidase cbb3-type subunit 3